MKRVALVTGASRGIGLAVAKKLESLDCCVVLCARKPTEETKAFLEAHPETTLFVSADISSSEDRKNLLQTTLERFGRLDILVNNAGVAPKVRKDMLEITEDDFDAVMDINLKGTYFLTQAAALEIEKQNGGYIVNTGSISSDTVSLNRAEYCMSKAGVQMLTKLFAVRLAPEHIGVFEISPGVIDTDMIAPVREKYKALAESGAIPAHRLGTPEDIANMVGAIVTGQLDYATGATLPCGGGMHIPIL